MQDRLTHLFQWLRAHRNQRAPITARLSRHYLPEPVQKTEQELPPSGQELALPALYGRYGILPDYFTDELLSMGATSTAMRAFLDIFNERLFGALHRSWSQHQLFLEEALNESSADGINEAFILKRMGGQLRDESLPHHIQGLRWNRMASFRSRVRTKEGLSDLVTAFFPDQTFHLETFVTVERLIPERQRPRLGKTPVRLGMDGDLLIGRNIRDPRGGIRIAFKNLSYEAYSHLLPGGKWRKLLAELVKDYTQGTPQCLLRLELRADQVPPWKLGQGRLDCDIWLKSKATPAPVHVDAGGL